MKIPKKKELVELQKKYRTDKKIGEVYGVPPRLVAYWRTKKNIGAYNLPKYSFEKILDIWERYGDDALAGKELGISGPGFRRWRKHYNILKKPAQLKMEQLELGILDIPRPKKSSRRETFIRKILANKAGLKYVEVGQKVRISPDLTFAVDNAGASIRQFYETKTSKVWDSSKVCVILNHLPMSENDSHADKHKFIRDFVRKQSIEAFYDIGWGIAHQVILEEGLILPRQLALGTDNYSASPGCIGAFAAKISPKEMAAIWSTGRLEFTVPETVKIVISGHLPRGVSTSDIMLKISREISKVASEKNVLEFHGAAISAMTVPQRFGLVNLAIEAGARSAIVPFDEVTHRFIKKITKAKYKPVKIDPDAEYEQELETDISYLTPQVVCPNDFKHINAVEEVAGKKIDHVVLGGFAHGCLDDLEIAAKILSGRRIHRSTRLLIIPGSRRTYLEALDKGYIRTFVESGGLVQIPSYGATMSALQGMLAEGERAMATTRIENCVQGHTEVYIASPATAAASALKGAITDPRRYLI